MEELLTTLKGNFFGGTLTVIGAILVHQFKEINNSVRQMSVSVNELNGKISVIIKDQEWHKEKIEKLEKKLEAK